MPPEARPPPFRAARAGTFLDSLLHAWSGLVHTVVHQRNMRMHLLAAVMVGLVGSGIPLGLAEKVTLIFCVLLIFFAEILNTSLEQLVDLAIQEIDEKARLSKDLAAAGVLVLVIGTVVIFAAILVHNSEVLVSHVDSIRRQVLFGVPFTFCVGALMHESRKPRFADALLVAGGIGLWAATVSWSESYVFSAMTFGLLVVAASAAWARQKARQNEKPGVGRASPL
ncbi:MAG: diacylglycerol kinase family protein [Myxococcales bacterium]|nr:diacylglycerol kinase family protein [Myxococcales bacterium]